MATRTRAQKAAALHSWGFVAVHKWAENWKGDAINSVYERCSTCGVIRRYTQGSPTPTVMYLLLDGLDWCSVQHHLRTPSMIRVLLYLTIFALAVTAIAGCCSVRKQKATEYGVYT